MQRFGGEGMIEEGDLAGRKYLLPCILWVERGASPSGDVNYAKACIKHGKFVPDHGCDDCNAEVAAEAEKNARIGL